MTFRRSIVLSGVLHLLVALAAVTQMFFGPSEPLELDQAIRVDIVGLPQKVIPDQPLPPEPPAKPAPPAKADPAPTPPPAPAAPKFVEKPKPNLKHEQKDAFAKLRAMEALKKMKEEAEAEARPKAKPAPPAPIAGHEVAKGNSLTGLVKLDYNRYGADVRARVLENWKVPSWLAESDLRAKVRVWIDDGGRVTRKEIYLSSGNDVFDQAALDAVDASNPFPAPPDNLRAVLAQEGFTLGLPK